MKNLLNKFFAGILIFLASLVTFIGMILGPLGYEQACVGITLMGCIFASVVIIFGLIGWKKRRVKK